MESSFTLTEKPDLNVLYNILLSPFLRKEAVENYIGYYKKASNGSIDVKYKQKISDGGISYGRYYPVAHGYTPAVYQDRYIRSELFSGNELDIDAVSCHPSIIKKMCSDNDVESPYLNIYLKEKKSVLDSVDINQQDVDFYNHTNDEHMTIDSIKKKIINSSLYKPNRSGYKEFVVDSKKNPIVKNGLADKFINEILTNRKIILSKNKYNTIISAYEKDFKEKNKGKVYHDGAKFSIIVQTLESEYVLDAINYFKKNNIEVTTYEYDGFQVRKDENQTMDEFKVIVNNCIDQYNSSSKSLSFSLKDFSEKFLSVKKNILRTSVEIEYDIKKITDSMNVDDDNEIDIDSIGVKNDEDACLKFINLHRYIVSCGNELYVFDKRTLKWISSSDDVNSIYSIFCLYDKELNVLKYNHHDAVYKRTEDSYGTTLKFQKILFEKLKQKNIDNKWFEESLDKSNGMILFKNGYYNINEKNFYNKSYILNDESEIQKCANYRFFNSTGYDYMIPDESFIQETSNIFLDIQLSEEEKNYYLSLISRSAFGEKLKHFIFVIGTGNTGKSLFNNLVRKTFGDYVGEFSLDNFSSSRKASDEAQQNRWAFLLRSKRICLSQELKEDTRLSAGNIKKVSSGGSDILQGRFHGGNETSFYYNPLHIGCVNDIKGIDGFDKASSNRIIIFEYDKVFSRDEKLINNTTVFSENSNYVNYVNNDIYKNSFFQLCIRQHEVKECPKIILNRNEEFFGNESDVAGLFLETFEFCQYNEHDKKNTFLPNSEVQKWMESNKIKISLRSFKKIIESLPEYKSHNCQNISLNNNRGIGGLRKKIEV